MTSARTEKAQRIRRFQELLLEIVALRHYQGQLHLTQCGTDADRYEHRLLERMIAERELEREQAFESLEPDASLASNLDVTEEPKSRGFYRFS